VSADQRWPVSSSEWEERAAAGLGRKRFDYIAGGAGEEATLRANREAFERRRLRPRVLTGSGKRSPAVEVLGAHAPAAFMLAPVGVLELVHAEADLPVARAAARTGAPMIVSCAGSTSMEHVAEALEGATGWFQLYWVSDREIVASLVRRAEAAGYEAIVVTVDTLARGIRDRDLRNGLLSELPGMGTAQFTSDPVFRDRLASTPEEDPDAAAAALAAIFPGPLLDWKDLGWLRDRTELPIVLKGILHPDDARRAFELGMDGVIVSNHGGRQVDGAVAALDALPEVRTAVGRERTVLMDGGVRRGSDVVKALALGADAVLLGRPYVYGLAVGGQGGVEQVIAFLTAEVDLTLALVGAASPRALDASVMMP
jgi:lactate 2-monooxygenase